MSPQRKRCEDFIPRRGISPAVDLTLFQKSQALVQLAILDIVSKCLAQASNIMYDSLSYTRSWKSILMLCCYLTRKNVYESPGFIADSISWLPAQHGGIYH